jgi:hypothetical protein
MLDGTFSNPYDYSRDNGWVLGSATVDAAFADASLPLSALDLFLPG